MASSSRDSPTFVALVQATAGACGGVFASFVLMPLEVIKTRIAISQSGDASTVGVAKRILQKEGVAGLFGGVNAKCIETGTKNFIYFFIYDALNSMAKRRAKMNTGMKLTVGYFAGLVNTTLTMPLEVMATRLQTEASASTSLWRSVCDTLAAEGLGVFFRGYGFNVALCVNPAIQNTVFDSTKAIVLRLKRRGQQRAALTPLEAFTLGAFGKAVATVLTFPLVRVKTMLQAGTPPAMPEELAERLQRERAGSSDENPVRKTSSTPHLLRALSFSAEPEAPPPAHQPLAVRLLQLYRGLGSALAKSVLQAALLYMTKDQVEGLVKKVFKISARVFFRRDGRLKLSAWSGRPLAS